jgi:hypothetical protein
VTCKSSSLNLRRTASVAAPLREFCPLVLGVSNSISALFIDFSGICQQFLLHIPRATHLNLVLGNFIRRSCHWISSSSTELNFVLLKLFGRCSNSSNFSCELNSASYSTQSSLIHRLFGVRWMIRDITRKMKHVNEQINFHRKIYSKTSLKFIFGIYFVLNVNRVIKI